MKTLFYRPVILALALLFCAPNPGGAADQDADALLHDAQVKARQVMEETKAQATKAVQEIRAAVQQLPSENQARTEQLDRQLGEEIRSLSFRIKQQAPSTDQFDSGTTRVVAGKPSPTDSDPYDCEEAQKKAEAALLRTGPNGPDVVPIVATSSTIVVYSDDITTLKKQILGSSGEVESDVVGLEQAMSDLGARVTGMAIVINLQNEVLFDFDKAALKPAAEQALAKVALIVKEKGKGQVRIDGHTDAKGSEAYNLNLSLRRAEAVKKWLVKSGGIAPDRLLIKGYGETRPVAANTLPDGSDNPEGRAKNRRVEITIATLRSAD